MVGAASERVAFSQKALFTMARHSYSLEFKDEACRLVMVKKQSITATAKSLNIDKSLLRYWIKKRGHSMTTPHELPSDTNDPVALKARIKELEARLRRSEMETDILKKATAYFATQSLNDSPSSGRISPDGRSK
jgi:transposase